MEKPKLLDLIQKVLRGKATDAEKKSLEKIWHQKWSKPSILEEMSLKEKEQLKKEIFSRIEFKKDQALKHEIPQKRILPVFPVSFQKIAATFIIFTITAAAIYLYSLQNNKSIIETAYGETMVVTLPDQSQVTLNGNSKISFLPNWEDEQVRQVWLSGEAYFDVVHTGDHKKFLVHISDGFAIEVLGTTFNVNARATRTRVVLNTGKIKLNIKNVSNEQELVMAPGDMVEFEGDSPEYKLEKVKPENYYSWKNSKLIFDNTPISEICLLIEETYGMEVQVKNESLLDHKVSGSVPNNNLQNLLFGLSESLNLEVKVEDDHIVINSN